MWARTGLLAAFALVLTYLESFMPLPIPVPGAKLGLANIPLLLALKLLGTKSALIIAAIKVLVTGLLFGSPLMIPYSAVGTFLALFAMRLLATIPGLHVLLLSVAGAVFHITGQLAVASFMLGTPLVWYSLPVLLVVACFAGVLTGSATSYLLSALDASKSPEPVPPDKKEPLPAFARRCGKKTVRAVRNTPTVLSRLDTRVFLSALFAYTVMVFCVPNDTVLLLCMALALALALMARIRLRDALKALIPLASILLITAIAQILCFQQGTALVVIGQFSITWEAVGHVAHMFARLLCVVVAGAAFVQATDTDRLIGALASLLKPLNMLGLKTERFVLALDLTIQFIPILLDEFKHLKAEEIKRNPGFGKGGLAARLNAYRGLLPHLAANAFAHADRVADGCTGMPYRPIVS